MSTNSDSILFIGATGGSGLNVLTRTLLAGYQATALVRSSKKLISLLKDEQSVPSNIVESQLHIVEGNITNLAAVEEALSTGQPSTRPWPRLIVSAIGGTPRFQASITQPFTMDQPNITAESIQSLFSALDSLYAAHPQLVSPANKPVTLFMSTTGATLPSTISDVPCIMYPMYHWLLSAPHEDKAAAEKLLLFDSAAPEAHSSLHQTTAQALGVYDQDKRKEGRFAGSIILRPSLLLGNSWIPEPEKDDQALQKVRIGTETSPQGPAVGYTIDRSVVGRWIFEEVVKPFAEAKEGSGDCKWVGEVVTITY